ncbi:hypothetical protein HHI36_023706 [Cryptolaemus montrouzieri]|uniref:Endonuclease-reverse transcriptase n=1 Tax=Cryptolaemus montrouzieri TaxID=559131 RepID=A0ABD2PHU6_9CUCU
MREWMGDLGLVVANVGNRPTLVRRDQKSILDITIVSEEREDRMRNWRVLEEEETLSLHREMMFEISENSNVNGEVKRKELRTEIYKSKQKKWRKLVEEVQKDVWRQGYRIVMGKLKKQGLKISAERRMNIINQLFECNSTRDSESYGVKSDGTEVSISKEEVEQALHELKEKNAPGLDGVTTEVLKALARVEDG